jgi:hypothetical protein
MAIEEEEKKNENAPRRMKKIIKLNEGTKPPCLD